MRAHDITQPPSRSRFPSIDDLTRQMESLSKDPKIVQWLVRAFLANPITLSDYQIRAIKKSLKDFANGVAPIKMGKPVTDVTEFRTLRAFINAVDYANQIQEFERKRAEQKANDARLKELTPDWDIRYDSEGSVTTIRLTTEGHEVATFVVDRKYLSDGFITVHNFVTSSRYKSRNGMGTKIYDWIEERFAAKGIHLMPSPTLTEPAYRFWSKRMPSLMRYFSTGTKRYSTSEGTSFLYEFTPPEGKTLPEVYREHFKELKAA